MFNKTEFNQSQWLKPYAEFNEKQKQKKIETKMNKCCKNSCTKFIYEKQTMENLKTRIDKTKSTKLVNNKKDLIKMDIKTKLYVT